MFLSVPIKHLETIKIMTGNPTLGCQRGLKHQAGHGKSGYREALWEYGGIEGNYPRGDSFPDPDLLNESIPPTITFTQQHWSAIKRGGRIKPWPIFDEYVNK